MPLFSQPTCTPHQLGGLGGLARACHHADDREVEGGGHLDAGAGEHLGGERNPRPRHHRRVEGVLDGLLHVAHHALAGDAHLDQRVLNEGSEFGRLKGLGAGHDRFRFSSL
jgi:hypothetical protein